jgi:hypothetical protein
MSISTNSEKSGVPGKYFPSLSLYDNSNVKSLAEREAAANSMIDEILKSKGTSVSDSTGTEQSLPPHLENFKQSYEQFLKKQIHLPVIGMLTPRTKKKISAIPTNLNSEEIALVESKVRDIKAVEPNAVYASLTAITDATRARLHRNFDRIPSEIQSPAIVKSTKQTSPATVKSLSAAVDLDKSCLEYFASVERRQTRQAAQKQAILNSRANQRNSVKPKLAPIEIGVADLKEKSSQLAEDGFVSIRSVSRVNSLGSIRNVNSQGQFSSPKHMGHLVASSSSPHVPNQITFCGPGLAKTLPTALGNRLSTATGGSNLSNVEAYSVTTDNIVAADALAVDINKTLDDANKHNRRRQKLDSSYSAFLDKLKCSMLDDYGLNVDEVFNRRRKYGKACYMLIYYVNMFKLKTTFAWLKVQVMHLIQQRRIGAAMTLAFYAKKFLNYKHDREIRRNLEAQAEARRQAEKRNRDRIDLASSLVLGLVRFSVVRKRINRRKAAIIIERHARGMIGRRLAAQMRAFEYFRFCCARIIQCCYRQRLARRRVGSVWIV